MKKMAVIIMSCFFLATTANAAPKKETNKPSKVSKVSKASTSKIKTPTKNIVTVNNKSKNIGKSRKAVRAVPTRKIAPPNISNDLKYVIFEYETGKILEEKNSTEVWPLASLTKLMTAHIFLKHHNDLGNCRTSITNEDTDFIKFTNTRLKKNTQYECGELLEAMLTVSDNYAASALARSIPGWTKPEFIAEMNKQASLWGLKNTKFVDSSGLSPLNVSSAKDYYNLTRNVAHTPFLSDLSSIARKTVATIEGHETAINNTNPLVRNGIKTLISKTGYIKESGYNLAYVSDSCEKQIGFIELGAKSKGERSAFANQTLNKYGCK